MSIETTTTTSNEPVVPVPKTPVAKPKPKSKQDPDEPYTTSYMSYMSQIEVAERLYSVMRLSGKFFRHYGQIVSPCDDGLRIIQKTTELQGSLTDARVVVEFHKWPQIKQRTDETDEQFEMRRKSQKPIITRPPLNKTIAGSFLAKKMGIDLPEIESYSRTVAWDDQWELLPAGYHEASKSYTDRADVREQDGTDGIDELLRDVAFATDGDRVNFIAMLLTSFLTNRFEGKPMMIVTGNQPGIGKSTLAQKLAIIRDGAECDSLPYLADDEKLEKELGTVVATGARTVLLDNVKTTIDSAILEKFATDPVLSFRKMGKNDEFIKAKNEHIVMITANTPGCGRDCVGRAIFVNLVYEDDPNEREYECAFPFKGAKRLRDQVIGELIHMIEVWKRKGKPEVNVKTRCRTWGCVIGGILDANGYAGFMENYAESAADVDDEADKVIEILKQTVDELKSENGMRPQDIVDACPYSDLFREVPSRRRSQKLGYVLKRIVTRKLTISTKDGSFHLVTKRTSAGQVYRLTLHSDA